MPEFKTLKPADPMETVRQPGRKFRSLSPGGELLQITPYWQRRINDGSVVVVPAPEAPEPEAPQPDPTPGGTPASS